MKFSTDSTLLQSLLSPKVAAPIQRGVSPAARAEQSRRAVIVALARWGHLRCAELARIVWPNARYAEQLCQRLTKVMERSGEILIRANAVGTRSFVLTRPGAALAEAMGIKARHGLDLASVSGATFIHRMIGTRYGIEREASGVTCYGEHAIAGGSFPISKAEISRRFGKLPDLLIIDGNTFDWVEIESSAKSKDELQKCLRMIRYCNSTIGYSDELFFSKLIFVCDSRLNHESRIRRAAKDLWSDLPPRERAKNSLNVHIVQAQLGVASKWLGMSPGKPLIL